MTDASQPRTPAPSSSVAAPQGGRLAGRLALITGASRGIGAAVAERFAREGAQLILLARTVGALEELDDRLQPITGAPSTLVPLDLRDFAALDRLGATIYERFGKLDILVANAGLLGALSPLGHVKPDAWQAVVDVNLTANYRLIRSLDPLLRRSDAGRAIFVTSGASQGARPYWGAYAATKAALDSMVMGWAGELGKTRVRANLIDPGATRTGMRAEAYPGEDPKKNPTPAQITETFVRLAEASCDLQGERLRAEVTPES